MSSGDFDAEFLASRPVDAQLDGVSSRRDLELLLLTLTNAASLRAADHYAVGA